eukprot:scpid37060/ scgid8570/ 
MAPMHKPVAFHLRRVMDKESLQGRRYEQQTQIRAKLVPHLATKPFVNCDCRDDDKTSIILHHAVSLVHLNWKQHKQNMFKKEKKMELMINTTHVYLRVPCTGSYNMMPCSAMI